MILILENEDASNEYPDQPAYLRRLIRIFTAWTWHKVRFDLLNYSDTKHTYKLFIRLICLSRFEFHLYTSLYYVFQSLPQLSFSH